MNFQRRPAVGSTAYAPDRLRTAQSLPPFFLTAESRRNIERLLPNQHYQRLRLYFDTFGCIRCSQSDVLYGSNGLCRTCINTIGKRLRKLDVKLRAVFPNKPEHLEESFLRPYRSARRLLADLVPKITNRSTRDKPIPKSKPAIYLEWLD